MDKRTKLVTAILLLAWLVVLAWQAVEHRRTRTAARAALINRGKDISTTLGLVLRSQRRFGVIAQGRLESAMSALIKPGDLSSIAVLNRAGETVASAGAPIDLDIKQVLSVGEYWQDQTVALMNLVDLGTNLTTEAAQPPPPIVMSGSNLFTPFGTNRPPRPPRDDAPPPGSEIQGPPRPSNDLDSGRNRDRERERDRDRGPGRGRFRDRRPPFGRPFWMNEEEYQKAIQKQGIHSFVLVLSTDSFERTVGRDLWLRAIIMLLASVSVGGTTVAWRNLTRSAELEVRLARAAELNLRLKEMNLAAAGLAHETKNPLNIIRGLAQLISRQEGVPGEARQKSLNIVDEADRVTGQLNDFINYSRPREVRRSAVKLDAVVRDVVQALTFDVEEKSVELSVPENLPTLLADERLLRQAIFNLLLNAIQSVPQGGRVEIAIQQTGPRQVDMEIRDNGPGVPEAHREDVFKPYFTTNKQGTGLGLAVVQQIVLAHGWEIRCTGNEPHGAVFRIAHVALAANA